MTRMNGAEENATSQPGGTAEALAETLTAVRRMLADLTAEHPTGEPMWCVFEQMGHARYPCRLTPETRFGVEVLRLDVPNGDGWVTTWVRPETMYALRPCSEEIVRHLAARWGAPEPASPYELPRAPAAAEPAAPGDDYLNTTPWDEEPR